MPVENKAPMVLGVGAALAGLVLLLRKKKPTLPEPLPDNVIVGLLTPPSEATMWSLVLTDWEITGPIDFVGRNGIDRLDIADVAPFEIPSERMFPLRIASLVISKWIDFEGTPALQQLYSVQSIRSYLWDWDIGDWGDEPDPTYREAFIPDYGSYYYNVAEERFE